jgi:hypothetical protein
MKYEWRSSSRGRKVSDRSNLSNEVNPRGHSYDYGTTPEAAELRRLPIEDTD